MSSAWSTTPTASPFSPFIRVENKNYGIFERWNSELHRPSAKTLSNPTIEALRQVGSPLIPYHFTSVYIFSLVICFFPSSSAIYWCLFLSCFNDRVNAVWYV